MDMTMKRSMVVVAAVFAAMSTSALADDGATKAATQAESAAVKLSDAELDGITAGAGALSEVIVVNQGKGAEVLQQSNTHVTCINCLEFPDAPAGTSGVASVLTPKGKVIFMPIRQLPF